MTRGTGKWLIVIGIIAVIAGCIIYFFGDKLHWFGRLPGDIRIERENFLLLFPVSSMIILSVVLNLIIWFLRKFVE
jgi:H+/Cl- antiporter ClcA